MAALVHICLACDPLRFADLVAGSLCGDDGDGLIVAQLERYLVKRNALRRVKNLQAKARTLGVDCEGGGISPSAFLDFAICRVVVDLFQKDGACVDVYHKQLAFSHTFEERLTNCFDVEAGGDFCLNASGMVALINRVFCWVTMPLEPEETVTEVSGVAELERALIKCAACSGKGSVDDGGETEPMPVEGQGVTVSAAHDAQGELVLVVGKCTDETKRSLDHWFVVWDLTQDDFLEDNDGKVERFSGVVWNYTGNAGEPIAVKSATAGEWFEMGCVSMIPVWV
mmetsp:Transcript_2838/g.4666  ORF Transcript_2838/g.4666 Transcript_2838/m.4666 type:complete len:283 (-) Transcript_2838:6-854(-)